MLFEQKKVLNNLQDSKTWRTFASLLKGKPPAKEFGKVVEWSITAVLKTAVLRGTGGSNPSLSAIRILQDVDYQSCRIFLYPKKCTKNAPNLVATHFYGCF